MSGSVRGTKRAHPFGMPGSPFDPHTGAFLPLGWGPAIRVAVVEKVEDPSNRLYRCNRLDRLCASMGEELQAYHLTDDETEELAEGTLAIAHQVDGAWWMMIGGEGTEAIRVSVVEKLVDASNRLYRCYQLDALCATLLDDEGAPVEVQVYQVTDDEAETLDVGTMAIAHQIGGAWWMRVGGGGDFQLAQYVSDGAAAGTINVRLATLVDGVLVPEGDEFVVQVLD